LQKALEYDIERQIGSSKPAAEFLRKRGCGIRRRITRVSQWRSKEKAHDYAISGILILLPVHVSAAWRDAVKSGAAEIAEAKRVRSWRFCITSYDAQVLTGCRILRIILSDG